MSAPPGWYPDPAGTPGRFRFWNGAGWSTETTDRPDGGPPKPPRSGPVRPPRRQWGWWLTGLALLVAVVVLLALVIRAVGSGGIGDPDTPGPEPSQESCPRAASPTSTVAPASGDRVRSGQLSYPRLPPPFGAPQADSRTPFGHDVQTQQAFVERSADGETTWVAWALIARLLAGDGFYGPEEGAEIVARCVVALFYDDHAINRQDTRREPITVDGRPAYLIESHLTFDIPGIRTKGEVMIVVVVDVGQPGEAGLFYGTVPDTSPQFLPPVRAALAGLEVG